MLASSAVITFIAVRDLDRASAFYGGVLGLELHDEAPFALVTSAAGTTIRLTRVDEPVVAPYTVLGWSVADIETTIDALAARGVRFIRYDGMGQDERGIWTAPGGDKVAWFNDPDGNNLSLTQAG